MVSEISIIHHLLQHVPPSDAFLKVPKVNKFGIFTVGER